MIEKQSDKDAHDGPKYREQRKRRGGFAETFRYRLPGQWKGKRRDVSGPNTDQQADAKAEQ